MVKRSGRKSVYDDDFMFWAWVSCMCSHYRVSKKLEIDGIGHYISGKAPCKEVVRNRMRESDYYKLWMDTHPNGEDDSPTIEEIELAEKMYAKLLPKQLEALREQKEKYYKIQEIVDDKYLDVVKQLR